MRLPVSLLLALALAALAACQSASPPTAPDAVQLTPTAMLPMGAALTAAWRRTGYAVTGTVTLVRDSTGGLLTFSSDFSIGQTPGPTVYLNTTANPNTGRPLRLGALKASRGAQQYAVQLPVGVAYAYVLIWCDPFNVPMAEAMLPATP